jgi:uncharacterized protein with HEPN domain
MTAARDYRDFLNDLVAACRSIIRFADGMTLDAYLADERTRYAVMRGYEILGEAVRHLPESLKLANPDIPWTTMAAVRNRIVHGYFGIDDSILFTTIDQDLKSLLPRFEALARAWRSPKGQAGRRGYLTIDLRQHASVPLDQIGRRGKDEGIRRGASHPTRSIANARLPPTRTGQARLVSTNAHPVS